MARGKKRGCGCRRSGRWSAVNVVAVVLGFMIYLPLGLVALAYTIWAKDPSIEALGRRVFAWVRARVSDRASHSGSDNRAFEAYRVQEIERIEKEREKLRSVDTEFRQFRERLQKARDREEFDRFLAGRV